MGYGRQRRHTELFQGADYIIDMVPKTRVDILVPDSDVDAVVQIIVDTARTDRIGGGTIWVMPVDSVRAVRTGAMDPRRLFRYTSGCVAARYGLCRYLN